MTTPPHPRRAGRRARGSGPLRWGLAALLPLAAIGIAWVLPTRSPEPVTVVGSPPPLASTPATATVPQPQTPDPAPLTPPRSTTTPAATATAEEPEIPFTADGVFRFVEALRLDESGNLVPDERARRALDRLLRHGERVLSRRQLQDLGELIRAGLPEAAGDQAAALAADYYDYLQARAALSVYATPPQDGDGLAAGESTYRQLQQLRTQHLGERTSNRLFQTADAHFNYMIAARRLQMNPDLSTEQKLARARTLNTALEAASVEVNDWPQRRARFLAEKDRILGAALSEREKQRQVDALFQTHFRADERRALAPLNLDVP